VPATHAEEREKRETVGMSDESTKWMTTREVCEYLRCSRSTLYRLRTVGHLPSSSLRAGGALRFLRADVDRYLMGNRSSLDESISDVVSNILK